MKPKFTEKLITGKGLPEVQAVEQPIQKADSVLKKAASLDLPSPTKVDVTPLQHKQYSLDVDARPKGHSECKKKVGGDIHPTKLSDLHLSVKEPDSPSHTEVDRVKMLPGKGKESSKNKKHKSPRANKSKDPQRKASLSELLHERKKAVTSRIKRTFSKSESDTKGGAIFYNINSVDNLTVEESTSSNSELGSNADPFESSGGTSDEGAKHTGNTYGKDVSNNTVVPKVDCHGTGQSVASAENMNDNNTKTKTEESAVAASGDNATTEPKGTVSGNNIEDVYENFEFSTDHQDIYENVQVVAEQEKGIKKLVPIPVIEIETEGEESCNRIGPSQDYIPMHVSGSRDYADMNRADSHSKNNRLNTDGYDNAEFDTKMYDNSLYQTKNKTESVYEAIEFHKGRELYAISRRSRLRQTAKKQKPILLEDDKHEAVNDRQVEGNIHWILNLHFNFHHSEK